MISVGNAEANNLTLMTVLEIWNCTVDCEASFKVIAEQDGITEASCGSRAKYEDEKYKNALKKHPDGRFPFKNTYINAVAFKRDAPLYFVKGGPWDGLSIWDALETGLIAHGDFAHASTSDVGGPKLGLRAFLLPSLPLLLPSA